MVYPEFLVIGLNVTVVLLAYFVIYPTFCKSNGYKIANNDLVATSIVLTVTGITFWDSGVQFSLLLFSVNWFWFTLLMYAAIELPIMLWYFKKHDVWSSFKI